MTNPIAKRLLDWYQINQRQLPWRQTPDPYAIWIAEVMLQQTRVETVIPYYQRWMERLPTVQDLAAADEQELLSLWEGLGYYRRVLNLQRAAQRLMAEFDGRLPQQPQVLQQLPGIGDYTAAAIAAIAFNRDEIALDGNLRRVLARLYNLDIDPKTAAATHEFQRLAHSLLPPGSAADFNQALMDLGSVVCTPRRPSCHDCPLGQDCQAFARGTQEELPRKKARSVRPLIQRQVMVIHRSGKVLLGRRPRGGLLGGMWEFPGVELGGSIVREEMPAAIALNLLGLIITEPEFISSYEHSYSHFDLIEHAFLARHVQGKAASSTHTDLSWVELEALEALPMGKVDRLLAQDVASQLAGVVD